MLNKKLLRALVPLGLFFLLLLFAGIFAITQETENNYTAMNDVSPPSDVFNDAKDEEEDAELLLAWTPSSQPRWFKSNAGGMALEETSRLAALRNKYALVIDYISSLELDPRLSPFYENGFNIEIRVLYNQGKESRRQWLFRDTLGNVRLNAVLRPQTNAQETVEIIDDAEDNAEENIAGEIFEYSEDNKMIELPVTQVASSGLTAESGFIEVFNENARIIKNYQLFEGGGDILTAYYYNQNILIKTETSNKVDNKNDGVEEYRLMYSDTYRYNRAYSLRYVERFYHSPVEMEPVRLSFSHRILDVAAGVDFFTENVMHSSDFMDNHFAGEGFRIVYDTDSRGRILTQTMTDDKGGVVWTIKNVWAGDRIVSTARMEGNEERLTEYEYDSAGNRTVQRDIRNGVLERQIFSGGAGEIEELLLNGVVVLRAYWENGRKIREERVRR